MIENQLELLICNERSSTESCLYIWTALYPQHHSFIYSSEQNYVLCLTITSLLRGRGSEKLNNLSKINYTIQRFVSLWYNQMSNLTIWKTEPEHNRSLDKRLGSTLFGSKFWWVFQNRLHGISCTGSSHYTYLQKMLCLVNFKILFLMFMTTVFSQECSSSLIIIKLLQINV